MAYKLDCEIKIGNYLARYANSITIETTWREIGDTATILMPNLSGQLERSFKVGDPIEIKIGYDNNLRTEFTGFISAIKPKTPFEIKCEDKIYELKRKAVNNGLGKAWKSISLKDLLNDILTGFNINLSDSIPGVNLSPFRVDKGVTVAQALQKLKEEYLLVSYFRNNTLFIGLPYFDNLQGVEGSEVIYDFTKNIISDSLEYKSVDDVKLKAKVTSILSDNTRIEIEVGDADGEQRNLFFRNIKSKEELEKIAIKELEKYKYDGYKGTFTTFGIPYVIHSATANLRDPIRPQRSGRYFVDKVKTTFGVQGFRREIELGIKVNS